MRVRLVTEYNVEMAKAHPDEIFVFGDNVIRKGQRQGAGQAVIRYEPNVCGIAVKRLPSTTEEAYFTDQDDEIETMLADLRKLYQLSKTHALVFPVGGIGTGRAQLKTRSPRAWARLNQVLREHFGIENGHRVRLVTPSLEP